MPQLVEGKYPLHAILSAAEKIVAQRTEGSTTLDTIAEAKFPKLQGRELQEGSTLGQGFFCKVNEITDIVLEPNPEDSMSIAEPMEDEREIYNHIQDRTFMEMHCRRGIDDDCRYALKRLKPQTCVKADDFINGIVDLAIEAKFLAVIRHPNIIKMRAMAYHGPYSTIDPYFIVLDRLQDTLSDRILKWRSKFPSSVIAGLFGTQRKAKKDFWNERVSVASDIASALHYLHEKHIIYRDLKGDNIGFDVRGDVKIFDFGLSKEFDPTKKTASGMYLLTECTGSPRYMAPEVALGQPYNESSDVYSFSLLLWQILKLATPFNGLNIGQLNKDVYKGNLRPKMSRSWPRSIRTMMKYGWGIPIDRPSMNEMVKVLRMECGLESLSQLSNDLNEPKVSQSFISAINLGYNVEQPKAKRRQSRAVQNPMPDITESHSNDYGEAEDGSDNAIEDDGDDDEPHEYSVGQESDMPCVSFITTEDLSRVLGDKTREQDGVSKLHSKSEPPAPPAPPAPMLFPFTPAS